MKHAFFNVKAGIAIMVCFSIAVFAQNEQPQPQQGQYQYPQQQDQYQYPPQQQGQYQQYPQQQGQYQYPPQQQYGSSPEQLAAIQQLIKSGLYKNKDEIQKASIYLSPADKTALYEKNKKKGAGGWAALDFVIGFGLGSYIQGDVAFGITQSVMDVAGYALMFIGAANLKYTDSEYVCYGSGRNQYCYDEYDSHTDEAMATLMVGGWVVLGASRIMSWIFPFVHQKGYNRTLSSALNGNAVSYSIDPLIVPRNGAPAVGLAFNMHY